MTKTSPLHWQSEWPLPAALLFGAGVFLAEHAILSASLWLSWAVFAALLVAIIGVSFRVAHHAEVLAHRYGEPYGTMILTMSAVSVEVVVLAILISDGQHPTLARDTIYAAVMLDMNGILGLAAIIGGVRHGEQSYNLNASNTYIAMLLVAIGLSMFVPDFLSPQQWQAYSVFSIFIMLLLYAVFLRIQTVEHRSFFVYGTLRSEEEGTGEAATPGIAHVALLIGAIILIGLLAELLSVVLEGASRTMSMPHALLALLVALVSASPEIMTALRSAVADRMQTVINIALGASLATVLLTVPVVQALALWQGVPIEMGLTPIQAAMLLLTILAAMINLHDGDTNVLEGTTHFALFMAFVALAFIMG